MDLITSIKYSEKIKSETFISDDDIEYTYIYIKVYIPNGEYTIYFEIDRNKIESYTILCTKDRILIPVEEVDMTEYKLVKKFNKVFFKSLTELVADDGLEFSNYDNSIPKIYLFVRHTCLICPKYFNISELKTINARDFKYHSDNNSTLAILNFQDPVIKRYEHDIFIKDLDNDVKYIAILITQKNTTSYIYRFATFIKTIIDNIYNIQFIKTIQSKCTSIPEMYIIVDDKKTLLEDSVVTDIIDIMTDEIRYDLDGSDNGIMMPNENY